MRTSYFGRYSGATFEIRSSIADLVALDNASAVNGSAVYVLSENETYILDTSNAFTAFGNLIIARTVGFGRWFRRSKAYVVGNHTLWYSVRSSIGGNSLFGFTPGQLLASSSVQPDIIVRLSMGASANAHRIACDNQGNVWVSSFRGAAVPWQVFKFRLIDILDGTGTVTPSITLTNALSAGLPQAIDHVNSIAFDKLNNLWVAGRNTALARGIVQQIPQSILSRDGSYAVVPPVSLQCAVGVWHDLEKSICFDGNSNLWLTSYYPPTPQTSKVLLSQRVVTDLALVPSVYWSGSNFAGPEGIAFGPTGLLWIANFDDNSIKAFNPQEPTGNPAPIVTITSTSIVGPIYISFDVSGNMWVLNYSNWQLLKFNASDILASGSPAPSVVLSYAGLVPLNGIDQGAGDFCFPHSPNVGGLLPSGQDI